MSSVISTYSRSSIFLPSFGGRAAIVMVGVRLLASAPAVALVDIIAGTEVARTGITGGSPPKQKVGRVGGRADSGGRPRSCFVRSVVWGGGGGHLVVPS